MKRTLEAAPDRDAFRVTLLDHYDRTARALPWRSDPDPYRVLVSEVMLQQTRVETVKGYFGAWLERFPTLESLAVADEDDVLAAWEGLGYYRRARSLHRAARMVREHRGGTLPAGYQSLLELPGVGEYTAGAVASIAFQEPVPAVDGNVRRVLARLFDVETPSAGWLRSVAAQLVDPERPGDWNQALMELGATICTPRAPTCAGCPVAEWCAALDSGTVAARPAPARRTAAPVAVFALAVLHRDGRILLEKRPETGLLAGMWALPEARLGEGVDCGETPVVDHARRLVEERGLLPASVPSTLPEVRHRYSHLDARYRPVSLAVAGCVHTEARAHAWVDPVAHGFALPVAQRKVIDAWTKENAVTGVA